MTRAIGAPNRIHSPRITTHKFLFLLVLLSARRTVATTLLHGHRVFNQRVSCASKQHENSRSYSSAAQDGRMAETDDDRDEPAPASLVTAPAKRVVGKPWTKGSASPNPGGRPRTSTIVKNLVRRQSPRSVRKLIAIANDPGVSKRLAAEIHRWFAEQAIGKPVARVAGTDVETPLFPGSPATNTGSNLIYALIERARARRDAEAAATAAGAPATENGAPAASPRESRGVS